MTTTDTDGLAVTVISASGVQRGELRDDDTIVVEDEALALAALLSRSTKQRDLDDRVLGYAFDTLYVLSTYEGDAVEQALKYLRATTTSVLLPARDWATGVLAEWSIR